MDVCEGFLSGEIHLVRPQGRKSSPLASIFADCPALPCPLQQLPSPRHSVKNSYKMSWKPCCLLCLKAAASLATTPSDENAPRRQPHVLAPFAQPEISTGTQNGQTSTNAMPFQRLTSQQVHIAIHLFSCHPLFHVRHASTLIRPNCSHTLNKAEQNPISTKKK